jgi:hypothetical protein
MDGKKSSWDATRHLRRNLDPKVCFFFDRTRFEEDQINNLYDPIPNPQSPIPNPQSPIPI